MEFVQSELDVAERDAYEALDLAARLTGDLVVPYALDCLAIVASEAGNHLAPAQLFGAADAARPHMGVVRWPPKLVALPFSVPTHSARSAHKAFTRLRLRRVPDETIERMDDLVAVTDNAADGRRLTGRRESLCGLEKQVPDVAVVSGPSCHYASGGTCARYPATNRGINRDVLVWYSAYGG